MAKKLSPAQTKALKELYETGESKTSKVKMQITFDKLVEYGYAKSNPYKFVLGNIGKIYTLTPEGLQLAESLFGSSDPDPDDSEPMTAQDAMLATEPVLARDWLSDEDNEAFAELNIEPLPVVATELYALFVEKDGHWSQFDNDTTDLQRLIRHTEKPNGMIQRKGLQWKIVRAENLTIGLTNGAAVVAENATADPQPASRVQWLRREDLPPVETVYFCQRMGYVHPTMRQNAPISSRRQAKQARVVCLPNMQRRTANKPVKVEKREPLHETVLQIVSRIQTPLTSQVRRIA